MKISQLFTISMIVALVVATSIGGAAAQQPGGLGGGLGGFGGLGLGRGGFGTGLGELGGAAGQAAAQPQVFRRVFSAPVEIVYDPEVAPLNEFMVRSSLSGAIYTESSGRGAVGIATYPESDFGARILEKVRDSIDLSKIIEMDAFFEIPDEQQRLYLPGNLGGGPSVYAANEETRMLVRDGRLQGILSVNVTVNEPNTRVDFRKLWNATLEELTKDLNGRARDMLADRLKNILRRGELLQQRREGLNEEVERLAAESAFEGDAAAVARQYEQLATDHQDASLKLAGVEARREAIQQQLAAATAAAGGSDYNAKIVEQQRAIVRYQEERVAAIQKANTPYPGLFSQADLSAVNADLAQAKIDLLRAEQAAAAGRASPQTVALSDALSHTTIELAERRAVVEKSRADLDQLRGRLADLRAQQREAERKKRMLAGMSDRLAAIEQELAELKQSEERLAQRTSIRIVPWVTPPSAGSPTAPGTPPATPPASGPGPAIDPTLMPVQP